jgi:ABC-type amino acid transport substrate-binding protein
VRRILSSAAAVSLAFLTLTACSGTNNVDVCDEIERAVSKSVIAATDTLAQPFSATSLEAAGAEIDGYLHPLRELDPQGALSEPTGAVVDGMDELLIALRAGDRERITKAASALDKTLVDVRIACR